MNCPRCNNIINSGENFCRYCGYSLLTNNSIPSYSLPNQNQPYNQNINNNQIPSYTSPNQNQNLYNNVNDTFLIDSYIGKNADKITTRGFSVPAFIFGPYYLLYRKMYKVAVIWILILIIINVVSFLLNNILITRILGALVTAAHAAVGAKFKDIYVDFVTKKVKEIKEKNPSASANDLSKICMQKGGTTILPIVLITLFYMILYTIIIFISALVISTIPYSQIENYQSNTNVKEQKVEDLKFTIPSETVTNKTINGIKGKYYDDQGSCTFTVTADETNDKTIDEYLQNDPNYDEKTMTSSALNEKINNYPWVYYYNFSTQGSYYEIVHLTIYNGKVYKLKSRIISSESELCTSMTNQISSSLKFTTTASSSM